jgi:hypothetical protein
MMGALLAKSDTVEQPPGLDGEDDEVDMDVRRSCRYFYGVTVSVALISDLRVWGGQAMAAMRKTNQELHRAIQADMKDFLQKNRSGTIQQWAITSEWTRDTVCTFVVYFVALATILTRILITLHMLHREASGTPLGRRCA